MAFKRVPQKFNASINKVVVGTGDKTITLGGENVLPFYTFDAPIENKPKVGIMISDTGLDKTLPGIAAFYGDAESLVDVAKKAVTAEGADFLAIQLASANPDGLEWALFGNAEEGYSENMALDEEDYGVKSGAADAAAALQEKTAFLPDYAFADSDSAAGTTVSGLVGSVMVAALAAVIALAGGFFRRKKQAGTKAQ